MINLGLQRVSHLVQPLFTAHLTLPWKAIHIAGTNGKGSIAALISTFLSSSGYSVGRFTSPHLIDRWDCITLNQRVVERERFLAVERKFKQRSVAEGLGASDFEILTVTAFELFTDEGVNVAVVECGLGGRLDATNVLRQQDVLVSVLAKVGLDHTAFLGDTVEKVAGEKVGIFKPGVPVVVDESNLASVLEVVRVKLQEEGWDGRGEDGVFVLPEQQRSVLEEMLKQSGLATHQRQNLLTAFTAYYLAEQRLALTTSTSSTSGNASRLMRNLPSLIDQAQASLQGRLEWLALPATLIPPTHRTQVPYKALLDGAHNPQSALALAEYVNKHLRADPLVPVTWILAAKNDKDVRSILSILLRPSDQVVTCSFGPVDGMSWVKSMDAAELLNVAKVFTGAKVEAAEGGSVRAAIGRAVELAEEVRGPVCLAGSLYLAGDVLRLVREVEGVSVVDENHG